ncbi:MAG: hypothetical protein DYG98_24805 [Haliscomenobacteraceae bacterium CHB4]|nr:hypothetical protein [Haliscomenobacteraceae bacterium CHB4]
MDGGRWTVDGGRWTVDGGRWTVDGGRWTVDGGRWTYKENVLILCSIVHQTADNHGKIQRTSRME